MTNYIIKTTETAMAANLIGAVPYPRVLREVREQPKNKLSKQSTIERKHEWRPPHLPDTYVCVCVCVCVYTQQGKVFPLQARCGPDGG